MSVAEVLAYVGMGLIVFSLTIGAVIHVAIIAIVGMPIGAVALALSIYLS